MTRFGLSDTLTIVLLFGPESQSQGDQSGADSNSDQILLLRGPKAPFVD